MKKFELLFTIILLPLDFLMIVIAALTAYYLRVGSFVTEIRPVIYTLTLSEYLSYSLLVSLGCLFIFALAGLYAIQTGRKFSQEFSKIFFTCSTAVLVIIVAIFLKRELFSSRFIILAAWGFAIVYVTIGRIIIYKLQKYFLSLGYGAKRVIIIGSDKNTNTITKELNKKTQLGYQIIKTYSNFNQEAKESILSLHKNQSIDEIIQTDPNLDKEKTLDMISFAETNHIVFKFSADLLKTKTSRLGVDMLAGIPIFEIRKTKLEGWGRIYKRIFDIIGSLFFIILLSPLFLITIIAIKITSKGPVIYKNKRVGQNSKNFQLYKFRSMYYEMSTGIGDAKQKEKSLAYEKELIVKQSVRKGALYKIKDDPRVTSVGKFIRKWSIDELPQFFNVLLGSMSLVGPRPHQPREVADYKKNQLRILDIKPGVTGMAQVSGRSDLEFDEEAKLDIYYMDNWSLWLDVIIVLKTPFVILSSATRKAL